MKRLRLLGRFLGRGRIARQAGEIGLADEIVAALRGAGQIVTNQVERDPIEPGRQLLVAPERLVGARCLDKGLLGEVFGLADIANVLDDETT